MSVDKRGRALTALAQAQPRATAAKENDQTTGMLRPKAMPAAVVVVRFVLLWLLRAFLLVMAWNELVRPLLLLITPAPPYHDWLRLGWTPALAVALLISATGADRPIHRPIQKFLSAR